MAALISHLTIGERVSVQIPSLRSSALVYGAFLLGCVLVDANNYYGLERQQTHFVELTGKGAPRGGYIKFLGQLDSLLQRPWDSLSKPEQAFVAGYLCHLAADEAWIEVSWRLLHKLGLNTWNDLSVPTVVMLITFNKLSRDLLQDWPAIDLALNDITIPEVFGHVPTEAFQRMWDVAQAYALDGGTIESYAKLLEGRGKTRAEIDAVRQYGEDDRKGVMALIGQVGGIEQFIQASVERSVQVVPQLWQVF
ncbi:MAG: hypothetical protein GY832_07870 [Chloroflexi bacterium]|nr:hypothetical protein [Chloroflexota bacterium]